MSYRGRFSKGCEGCRARKVKCDEAKPICGRCIRSQQECKYRDQDSLLFRNETTVAAQRAEDSWRKRSKLHLQERNDSSSNPGTEKPSSSTTLTGLGRTFAGKVRSSFRAGSGNTKGDKPYAPEAHVSIPEVENLAISPAVEPDLVDRAYTRFLYDFVTYGSPNRPQGEPVDAIYIFVPGLYERTAPGSCLATIVQAVSYANFANRCNAPEAAAQGEECFTRGITMLSKIISDKQKVASDEVLCSTYLMGVYENLSSFQNRGAFVAHQDGSSALLRLRTIAKFVSNPVSAALYEVAFTQMLLANLQAAKHPPIAIGNVLKMGKHLPSIYNDSNLFIIQLLWREAKVHALWHDMKQSQTPPRSRSELQELLQSALDLDVDYQAWEVMIPPTWRYQMQPNTAQARATHNVKWQKLVLGSVGAPGEIHSHMTLKQGLIWGFYRTSRMFCLRDTLEMLNWMFKMPEPGPSLHHKHKGRGRGSGPFTSAGLDNDSLGRNHTLTTMHMINTIEKASSAILSNFTVAVEGKSFDDEMGMRGYVVLWPLGTMDAILSSGLIPDSKNSTADATRVPPMQGLAEATHSSYYDTSSVTARRGSYQAQSTDNHDSNYPLTPISVRSSPAPPLILDATAGKRHVFDSSPDHPDDQPIDVDLSNVGIKAPRILDVGARREWLNSMLYYIGSELGIKKALAVPHTQGYMSIVKPKVDAILGR